MKKSLYLLVSLVLALAAMLGPFSQNVVFAAAPTITSATYNAATGVVVVTGTEFVANGGGADIDASKFTFTGEGGATYTLTTTSDPEITSSTQFTLLLSTVDLNSLNMMLNKDGTSSTSGTTYNLAAAEDWDTGVDPLDTIADLTGNGITVSNVSVPTITSATYDASTGSLVVTGANFLIKSGPGNDINVSRLTFTGEGGDTYTLAMSDDVEITSGTNFTVTLGSTDKNAVNQILNKNGTESTIGTTYNLAAADDWATGADPGPNIADLTGNDITVSNVAAPAITSAVYDVSTGTLTVTGYGFLKKSGLVNDIDVSKLTIRGEGGLTYTLVSTSVEITSGTSFTVYLGATDMSAVNQILNKNGVSSTSGTTYNMAAAEDWAAGADPAVVVADLTNNGMVVTNVAVPAITSAAYNASTGTLIVTGTNFLIKSGPGNDIVVSRLTFSGEGGDTYTLAISTNVDITSGTIFTVNLGTTDKNSVNQILNKNGTESTMGITYNLAAADDWAAGADPGPNIADITGNGITVSNVGIPSIDSATYDASAGTLTVTGAGFLKKSGLANDIDVSKLTLTGEGGETYTLVGTSVEITSGTNFTVFLGVIDKNAVNQILNKIGTSSTSGTTYNLAAAEDWAAGADPAVNVADLTANSITVSNIGIPAITSVAYDTSTGTFIVTGSNFLKKSGPANDIDVSKFSIRGEGGATYTLIASLDVEIDSSTQFTFVLNTTDRTAVSLLINKSGTSSNDNTVYNLAAEEDWAVGADLTVVVSDAVNPITAGSTLSITSFSPSTARAGDSVVIYGNSFGGVTAVWFGGVAAADFNIDSATQITAIVGNGASGSVTVDAPGSTASKAGFTFIPPPTIAGIDPDYGPKSGRIEVILTGADFVDGAGVTFGGIAALEVAWVNAATLRAIIPAGQPGYQDVVVTNPDGQTATLAGLFYYQQVPAVGGEVEPVNRLKLLGLIMGMFIALGLAFIRFGLWKRDRDCS